MWSSILMIQHAHFPEDRYFGALFEEQKGHSVFYVCLFRMQENHFFFLLSLSV